MTAFAALAFYPLWAVTLAVGFTAARLARHTGRGLVLVALLLGAWVQSLAGTPEAYGINRVPVPLLVRLPFAAALVTWGALTNRPWTVPLAAMLALPTIWTHSLSMVAGSLALLLPNRKAWFRAPRTKAAKATAPAAEGSPA